MPEQLKVLDLFSGIRSADSVSGLSEPVCEPSSSSSATPSAKPSSDSTGQTSLFTATSETLPLPLDLPTSSAEDSPARTSALQEQVPVWQARAADYGRSTPDSFARLDPDTSSWKTSQHSVLGGLESFSETFPRSGMTRSGTAYQLPPLVPLTDETESGSLPTPTASSYGTNQGGAAGRVGPVRMSLQTMAMRGMLPTPRCCSGLRSSGANRTEIMEALRTWPTPTVKGNYNKAGLSSKSGDGLATAVMLATPTARDWRSGKASKASKATMERNSRPLSEQIGGPLNPTWVEWLMGFTPEWTVCVAWETRSSRRSRKSSAEQS